MKIRFKQINSLLAWLLIFFTLCTIQVVAQISEGGIPPSFAYQQTQRSVSVGAVNPVSVAVEIETTNVPIKFYSADLQEVDGWHARAGNPMPVAKLIDVNYTIDNSGQWTTLPTGEHIWRLHLKADGAYALMLYYNDFYIPDGGRLFIYSADKQQILGAYTHRTNVRQSKRFATEFVAGDELILEYVAATPDNDKPRISINEIGYGYNRPALRSFCGIETRASSAACMVDINCEEGSAWQNEKKGVCHTVQKIKEKAFICSGALMNNTAEDFRPLILTAYHCSLDNEGGIASKEDMEQWVFYFHYERYGCNQSSLPVGSKTMSGCQTAAKTRINGESDGLLVLLKDEIPENYDVFYNGWDRRDKPAVSGVCIHHPSGDYKKISTFSKTAQTTTFLSSAYSGATNAHWNVIFDATPNGHSVTEGGSSGSPLYNENKLVVGSLTGGSSTCTLPKGLNLYGKLYCHWNKYLTDSTRMDMWLDPLSTGVETLNGRFRKIFKPAPDNLQVVNQGQNIYISWKQPKYNQIPVHYNIYRNNRKIGESTILSFLDTQPISGTSLYSVSAVYANEEESIFATVSLSYIKYNAPTGLKAERRGESVHVDLSWLAPVNEQSIYWGTLDAVYGIGFSDDDGRFSRKPFYFGQQWQTFEIQPLNKKTIRAVQFIPVEGNAYEVFITQGRRTYRQAILTSLKKDTINTIDLTTPFVIDGSQTLIVSICVASVVTEYPAVCDMGPAYQGKGNLFSFDGVEWYTLFTETKPEDYNFNFIVAAIVTSEEGLITLAESLASGSVSNHEPVIKTKTINNKDNQIIVKKLSANNLTNNALRSSMPLTFAEVTSYKIYRDGSYLLGHDVEAPTTTYMDNTFKDYRYEVSAVYGGLFESDKIYANTVADENIDVDIDLYPTMFSNAITLKGYSYVSRVEAITVSGQICLIVNRPEETIDTSSLPPGVYFFRLYEGEQFKKTVRAIKRK